MSIINGLIYNIETINYCQKIFCKQCLSKIMLKKSRVCNKCLINFVILHSDNSTKRWSSIEVIPGLDHFINNIQNLPKFYKSCNKRSKLINEYYC